MKLQLKHETLWLGKKENMNEPSSAHAILWPAYEYTVMIYSGSSGGPELNPFERAVIGLVEIGIIQIKKQAELLKLHEAFVAHLHTDLINREILDGSGNLKSKLKRQVSKETQMAFHMYQDPWSGQLWHRLSSADYRKTMVAEVEEGKIKLIVGTTGDPIDIKALEVTPPNSLPKYPTSDDASTAMRSWFQIDRSVRKTFRKLKLGPIKIFPNTQQLVYLCCLNQRGEFGKPIVDDPFGLPSWRLFLNRVALVAEEQPSLGWWLYGKSEISEAEPKPVDVVEVDSELNQLKERLNRAPREYRAGDKTQVRLDLKALGHQAIDLIWKNRTQDYSVLLLDAQIDFDLICALAIAIGFEVKGLSSTSNLKAVCESNSGTLRERCTALLLAYRSDLPSVMHHLAEQCPNIFFLLEDAESGYDKKACDLGLVSAVEALVNASKFVAEVV